MLARLLTLLTTGEVSILKRRIMVSSIAYGLAGIFGLFGLVFLVMAGFMWTAEQIGPMAAAIYFGLGFFGLVVLTLIGLRIASALLRRAQRRKLAADRNHGRWRFRHGDAADADEQEGRLQCRNGHTGGLCRLHGLA